MSKERFTSDKLSSLKALLFGNRAIDFDAILPTAPGPEALERIMCILNKEKVKHVIFDLDGTLVPPYANITHEAHGLISDYLSQNIDVVIYTNSPYSDRLTYLEKIGCKITPTTISKPAISGFQEICSRLALDPNVTAMIGNFPITDMPLTGDGEPPYLALNILVESIAPKRYHFKSWGKFFRAYFFHSLALITTQIVLKRNPALIRTVE